MCVWCPTFGCSCFGKWCMCMHCMCVCTRAIIGASSINGGRKRRRNCGERSLFSSDHIFALVLAGEMLFVNTATIHRWEEVTPFASLKQDPSQCGENHASQVEARLRLSKSQMKSYRNLIIYHQIVIPCVWCSAVHLVINYTNLIRAHINLYISKL